MLDQLRPVRFGLDRSAVALRVMSDYLALTKPPIILLLLVTAIGGMFVAGRGNPSVQVILLVCAGGSLGAGGANALNHYLDKDIDGLMTRTAQRPVPSGRISPLWRCPSAFCLTWWPSSYWRLGSMFSPQP